MTTPAPAANHHNSRKSGRVAVTLVILAVMLALIAWLVNGFRARPPERNATASAEPTAAVTACGVTMTDIPGAMPQDPGSLVPVASVTFDNPTSADVVGRALVDFSGVGLGEASGIRVGPHSEMTVKVNPHLDGRPEGYDCTIAEATFSKG